MSDLKKPRRPSRFHFRRAHLKRFLRQWCRARPARKRATIQRYLALEWDLWLGLNRSFDVTAEFRLLPEIPRTLANTPCPNRSEKRLMYWPAQILGQHTAARRCN